MNAYWVTIPVATFDENRAVVVNDVHFHVGPGSMISIQAAEIPEGGVRSRIEYEGSNYCSILEPEEIRDLFDRPPFPSSESFLVLRCVEDLETEVVWTGFDQTVAVKVLGRVRSAANADRSKIEQWRGETLVAAWRLNDEDRLVEVALPQNPKNWSPPEGS